MKIKVLNQKCRPTKKHDTDAGIDCYLNINDNIGIMPNQTVLVPLGFKMKVPKGYAGIVKARSSIFTQGINIDGVIDSDYRGEVMVMVQNVNSTPFIIAPLDRICQIVVTKIDLEVEFVDDLDETIRGTGGFGSTNKEVI